MAQEPTNESASLLAEHETCLQAAASLEAFVLQPGDGDEGWFEQLRERVGSLEEVLRSHFRAEETSYLYVQLPMEAPRFARRLTALVADHDPMLETARALADRTDKNARRRSGDTHDGLCEEAQSLIARLRQHEAEEREIMVSANWDDLGEG